MKARKSELTLIQKLEAATGPSRELDALIAEAHGIVDYLNEETLPRYTESVDAAATLVPERHTRAYGNLNENGNPWACVTPHAEPCPDYTGEGATEAITLVIAALKAVSK